MTRHRTVVEGGAGKPEGKDGKASATRKAYLLKLGREIFSGEPEDTYTNAHMQRGKALEDEALRAYTAYSGAPLQRVGFIKNGQKGCSPDALIGYAGIVECKTMLPHLAAECRRRGTFPSAHRPQCMGALWACEREWCDLVVFWPRAPLFVRRCFRDERYIAMLAAAVDQFNCELHEVVELMKTGRLPAAEAA
jgi:hypothetical protein